MLFILTWKLKVCHLRLSQSLIAFSDNNFLTTVVAFDDDCDEGNNCTSSKELIGEIQVTFKPKNATEVISQPVNYPLYTGDNTIGRIEVNDICINHATMSSKHLLINCTPETTWVTDLGSTNKTKLYTTEDSKTGTVLDPHAKVIF